MRPSPYEFLRAPRLGEDIGEGPDGGGGGGLSDDGFLLSVEEYAGGEAAGMTDVDDFRPKRPGFG